MANRYSLGSWLPWLCCRSRIQILRYNCKTNINTASCSTWR